MFSPYVVSFSICVKRFLKFGSAEIRIYLFALSNKKLKFKIFFFLFVSPPRREGIFLFTCKKFCQKSNLRDLKKSIRWRALREPLAHSHKGVQPTARRLNPAVRPRQWNWAFPQQLSGGRVARLESLSCLKTILQVSRAKPNRLN